MKLLLWRTVLLAECFFHSASKTSDLSAPLKARAHLSEPPGRKGAAAPPAAPGPVRPGPARLPSTGSFPGPARLPTPGSFPGPAPHSLPRPSRGPSRRAAPGHGRRGREPRRLEVGLGGMGTRGDARPWRRLPASLLTPTSREGGHHGGCWEQSQDRDTSAAARRAEPAWDVASPSQRRHLSRAFASGSRRHVLQVNVEQ